ncbi:MAG: DUF1232 domain-containing protein [Deltaproteobacteria bacterium]|nr:DUF1232 domain-containing protein [Candidatus Tharpella aukensis]
MSLTIEEQDKAITFSKKLADEFDVERAANFSQGHKDKDWYEGFTALFNMITDIDFSMSAATWATIAGALAYVVFPVDIIPDFIPFIGWLDDVFIINWAVSTITVEISLYRKFCLNRQIYQPMLMAS